MKRLSTFLFAAFVASVLSLSCPQSFGAFAQQAYVKASNTGEFDQFGTAVAISGDTMIVGAPGESSNAIGINGSENNDAASESGAAYIYVRSGITWKKQAYLKASDSLRDFTFGAAVSISGDTVVVGAPGAFSNNKSGAAYVFVRSGTNWAEQAVLRPSNEGGYFGGAVGVSGNTIVVGAHRESSNGTGVNGSQTNYTRMQSGAAYVFARNGESWTQTAYLKASNPQAFDSFGYSVSVSAEGRLVVVGAPEEDSSATGVNGNESNDNAPNSGAAYVFILGINGLWSQSAYLKASHPEPGDNFGRSVSLSAETILAGILVVGAPNEDSNATGVNGDSANDDAYDSGAAYVFSFTGNGVPVQEGYLKASNTDQEDAFGTSVAGGGDTVVVGAREEDSNGPSGNNSSLNAGAAYVFSRSGTNWIPQAYLKASNPALENQMYELTDLFGSSVAISGDTVVIGAPGEASNAMNVDGNQDDNSLSSAGAAYVFAGTPVVGGYASMPSPGSVIDFGFVDVTDGGYAELIIANTGPDELRIESIQIEGLIPGQAVTFVVCKDLECNCRLDQCPLSLPTTILSGPSAGRLKVALTLKWNHSVGRVFAATLRIISNDPVSPVATYGMQGTLISLYEGCVETAVLRLITKLVPIPSDKGRRTKSSALTEALAVTLNLATNSPYLLTTEIPSFLGGGMVQLSNFSGSAAITLLPIPNDTNRAAIRVESGMFTAPSFTLPSGLVSGPNVLTFGPPEQSSGLLDLANGHYEVTATATITNSLIPFGVTVRGSYTGIYNSETGQASLQSDSRDLFESSDRVQLNHSPSGHWLTWANTNALEEATSITGPWRILTNAVSPHLVSTTNQSQQFFRLRFTAP